MPQPAPYFRATPYSGGVLTPEQWASAVEKQRIDKVLPKYQNSAFGGIVLRPRNVRFATQNKGEKVYILLRRHWITNLGWLTSNAVYAILPPVLFAIARGLLNFDVLGLLGLRLSTLLGVVYYSILITNVLRLFIDWYFNLYIVTNERVLDYDFKTFTSRGVSETDLDKIQDVKEISVGIVADFFNFGDVSIFTAADQSVITFHAIPRPTFVRDKITDLADIVKSYKNEP